MPCFQMATFVPEWGCILQGTCSFSAFYLGKPTHTSTFPQSGGTRTIGASSPAAQRAVEPVLVSTSVIQPFHFTPFSSTSPKFTHTGSQQRGCWWTALKIVFADSAKKVSEEFNFRRKICSSIRKMLFLTLEVSAFPTGLCRPQSHPPVTQLQTLSLFMRPGTRLELFFSE